MSLEAHLPRRLVLAVVAALALMLTAPAISSAVQAPPDGGSSAPSKATIRKAKKVAEKVAMERVHGPLYGKYYEELSPPLNWDKDGCSIPDLPTWAKFISPGAASADALRDAVAKFFRNSCDRHDFGYRNWGPKTGSVKLHPTKAGKKRIDRRLLANMRIQCDEKFGRIGYLEHKCDDVALLIYAGVRTPIADGKFFSKG